MYRRLAPPPGQDSKDPRQALELVSFNANGEDGCEHRQGAWRRYWLISGAPRP
jgi:hypothetical protein